jgi:superfamily II DNA or RNA helicase
VIVKFFDYNNSDKKLFAEKKMRKNGKTIPAIQKMITNIGNIDSRNQFLCNILKNLHGRKTLVLSARIDHLDTLKNLIDIYISEEVNDGRLMPDEITTGYYIGGMKKLQRKASEDCDIIFGTYSMASEGLDIPGLNTLLLAQPKSDVIQSIGRIMRKPIEECDIFPLIIDVCDDMSIFSKWGCKRSDLYHKNNYTVDLYESYNSEVITIHKYLEMNGVHVDKNNLFEIRKEYTLLKYGNSMYEMIEDENFEEDPLDNYAYFDNLSNIFA